MNGIYDKIETWVKREYNPKLVDRVTNEIYNSLVDYENNGKEPIPHNRHVLEYLNLIKH